MSGILRGKLYQKYKKAKIDRRQQKKRVLIQKNGFDLLGKIHLLLNGAGIAYFIDFGTLLGVLREGGLLKHDLDVDLGVLSPNSDTIDKVFRVLSGAGCSLRYEYLFNGKIVEQSYIYKGVKFDICYYDESKGMSFCYLFYRDPDGPPLVKRTKNVVRIQYEKIEGVELYQVHGVDINIPKNAYRLLEEKYGADWRIPNKGWLYWESPTAIKCNEVGVFKKYKRYGKQ